MKTIETNQVKWKAVYGGRNTCVDGELHCPPHGLEFPSITNYIRCNARITHDLGVQSDQSGIALTDEQKEKLTEEYARGYGDASIRGRDRAADGTDATFSGHLINPKYKAGDCVILEDKPIPRTYSYDDVIAYRKKLDEIAQTQFADKIDASRYWLLRTMLLNTEGLTFVELSGGEEFLDAALDELLERQSNPETSFGAAAMMDMHNRKG